MASHDQAEPARAEQVLSRMRLGVAAAAKGSLGFSKRGHRAFRKHAGSVCQSVKEQLGSAGLCWTRAAWDGSLAAAMTGLQSLVNEQDRNLLDGYNRVLAAIERAHLEGLKQPAEAPKTPKQPACSRRNPRLSKEAAGGADQQTIRCSVKIPQGRLLQLQMPRSADVKTLKGAISARTAIPTLEQKLVAGGKPLRDAIQLGEACAGEELNVVVNFGLAGGAGGADAAGSPPSAMEVSVSPRIRIRNHNTGDTCTLVNPPRLCKDVLEHLDTTEGWGRGKLTETLEGEVISIPVNDQVHAGSYTFREVRAAARWGGAESAGPSGDVAMPDVDYRRSAGTRQIGAAARPSQDTVMQDASRGDYRRRSNDDDWDDSVDEEVSKILERAFVSPEKNGQPELDLRPPPSSNPCARRDVSVVYFRESPSLLLTELPGRNEDGLTNAQTLLAENKQLHASGKGQGQVQTRATALIAPSGGGKSRTALEASCHEYSFYLSFSTEKEPGSNILREAIDRLRERHRDEYARVRGDAERLKDFRENMLLDMEKFITRFLLTFALGLRKYLSQHGSHASPKGFLLFQLIGVSAQEDWVEETWRCLLGLSREAVKLKLQAVVEELRRWTNQDFFNTFLDEAQAGMRIMDGYFPSRDGTGGRPLLNGWVRSLHKSVFAHFHFNLTGTGLSLRLSQQLDSAVSEEGAAQLASFTDFPPFTMDGALQYAQEFLQSPPEGAWVHILAGRPRFAAQLVQKVLLGMSWEEALQALVELHSGQDAPTSLLRGLHEMQTKLSGDLFDQLVAELRCLVLGYYVVGKGVSTGKTNVDMIEVGVCHLAHLGGVGEYSMMTLVEPLAALAVTSFLRTATHWRLEDQGLALLRTSPSDAAMGALFERIIPRAQLRFLTSSCLAEHPLFKGLVGLPDCFYGAARVVSLLGQGEKSYELKIDDIPRVETWRKGRGLIEFLREPGDVSFFFPEEGAGPDHASYLSIADELWLGILQAKCRKKVPNKAHALGTLNIRTMYKGEKNPGEKRSQLTSLLQQRGVKGILRILLAYPAEVNAASYAQSMLRHSERLKALEGNEFEIVQLCISRSNAEHYLAADERHHLDCLKDVC